MSGYYGTDAQQTLQRCTFEGRQKIAETPGLYNAGRFIGTDDPDRLGWDTLKRMLEENGVLGFRLITHEQSQSYYPRVVEHGYRIDTWDVFIASAESVRARVDEIVLRGPPNGTAIGDPLRAPDSPDTTKVQRF